MNIGQYLKSLLFPTQYKLLMLYQLKAVLYFEISHCGDNREETSSGPEHRAMFASLSSLFCLFLAGVNILNICCVVSE